MRIIVIGDIHGRTIWKDIVNQEFDLCVFLGDYVDSHDRISAKQQGGLQQSRHRRFSWNRHARRNYDRRYARMRKEPDRKVYRQGVRGSVAASGHRPTDGKVCR